MMTNKDSSAAGTDNRPPMLEENNYKSWRIRIERYIKGKPHGKLIWKSIQNGPTPHPQTTDPALEGSAVPPSRNKKDEEFTEEDNKNKLEYIQAINILSQGLLRRIFNILNQNETGREIWRRASGNIGTKGIQSTGSGVNNSGKKVICYNCRREGHVARQCKELKRARDS
nr:hypothetical protein [Tanacetum cinerariifolium]